MAKQSFFDYLIRSCEGRGDCYKKFSSFLLGHVPEDERIAFDPAKAKVLIYCDAYCGYVDELSSLLREYNQKSA